MVRVKVCGITSLEDALVVSQLGFHALGFIMAKSPRQIETYELKKIILNLPPFLVKVGVFVNEDGREISRIARDCSLHHIQLHGMQSPRMCRLLREEGFDVIKAISLKDEASLDPISSYLEEGVSAILFDTYHPQLLGGTGEVSSWDLARRGKDLAQGRIILAGGLGPENIRSALTEVSPMALDINSKVEMRPGKKDPTKLREVMELILESRKDDKR